VGVVLGAGVDPGVGFGAVSGVGIGTGVTTTGKGIEGPAGLASAFRCGISSVIVWHPE
jgi:hypothetical protein